jgi:hypothetical protein
VYIWAIAVLAFDAGVVATRTHHDASSVAASSVAASTTSTTTNGTSTTTTTPGLDESTTTTAPAADSDASSGPQASSDAPATPTDSASTSSAPDVAKCQQAPAESGTNAASVQADGDHSTTTQFTVDGRWQLQWDVNSGGPGVFVTVDPPGADQLLACGLQPGTGAITMTGGCNSCTLDVNPDGSDYKVDVVDVAD